MKIIHLTSVHTRYDNRIFFKQCCSLTNAGHDVSLVVADGKDDEIKDGVHIYDVGDFKCRLKRMIWSTYLVFKKARELGAQVYHFHDPELLPWGLILRISGKKVIYDMHENLPKQVHNKTWLPTWSRYFLSSMIRLFERIVLSKLYIVMAELSYTKDYVWVKNKEVVLNLPIIDGPIMIPKIKKDFFTVGYIGGVSRDRGIPMAAEALVQIRQKGVDVELICVGNVNDEVSSNSSFQKGLSEGWLHSPGWVPSQEALPLIACCHVGVALLRPIGNYIESYPTKMFEYMAMGIPVLVSNFPLYRRIVYQYNCGLCVEPEDIEEVKRALIFFLNNPDESRKMGLRGRRAVEKKYNWGREEEKLLQFYFELIGE
jgi:glycosyltransferase involved in cell wall biosynthesis